MLADVARTVAAAALGRDPGPLAAVDSLSHHVFLGTDVVVKVIDADRHTRLGREIALAPHLPAALTAPLLASGVHGSGPRAVRYACYGRVPGKAPGMGLPGVDAATARRWAGQAVERLGRLHAWTPPPSVHTVLRQVPDHGGFTGRAALRADLDRLAALDRGVPGRVLDGVARIAARAPAYAPVTVPVHADCHWGNWLVRDGDVTALLDFEWARLGAPVDDWFFLARFSGPHAGVVLDVVSAATGTPVDVLRGECELREAAYLLSDLLVAWEGPDGARMAAERLRALQDLTIGRYWWRPAVS